MRRIATTAIGGLLAFCSVSCSDSSSRLLAEVAYQLTCTGTTGGPSTCNTTMFPGSVNPTYDYRGYHLDVVTDRLSGASIGVLEVDCEAVDIGNGNVQLTVGAITDNGAFQIRGLNVSRSTGAYVASACRATFEVGGTTYGGVSEGACSDQAPSAAAPCQITNVVIDPDHADGPSVDMRVFCTALPNEALPAKKLSVRDSQDTASPAFLHFAGCGGI